MSTKIKTPDGWKDVAGGGVIDDDTTSVDTTWSSSKINDELVNYGKKEIADCDTVEETISYIAPDTLHSPKAEGLTPNARGILISAIREAPDDYCVQTAIMNGSGQHFTRHKDAGNTWSTWTELVTMDKFNDNTMITPTYDSTLINSLLGGYKIIGKMVIVNMRFKYNGSPNTRADVADLPVAAYGGAALTIEDWYYDTHTTEYALAITGKLRIRLPVGEGREYCVTGVYFMN